MAGVGRDHIGPYRCLKMIQVGNATQIWQAMNSTDHLRVAIKIPRDEFAKDKGILSELKHEYEVARSLDHPGIVRVYELSYVRRIPYLVMEYFPAPNLKQCLRQDAEQVHQLSAPNRAAIGARPSPTCTSCGWVHRDLKPENLLMGEGGQVKLIDFAIAARIPKGLRRLWKSKDLDPRDSQLHFSRADSRRASRRAIRYLQLRLHTVLLAGGEGAVHWDIRRRIVVKALAGQCTHRSPPRTPT